MKVRQLAVTQLVSPLEGKDFVWPSHGEILRVQRQTFEQKQPDDNLPNCHFDQEDMLYKTEDDKIWIPSQAGDLQQRLLVVAHAGASGHFGADTTLSTLRQTFGWDTIESDVKVFVGNCLHCMAVGGVRVPRPLGETVHATKPNELLHFDFLTLPTGANGANYVLVLRDDMSGYVELIDSPTATAEVAAMGLLDWFKRFGVVAIWVSDQGAHFKNQVMEHLRKAVGAHHHFTIHGPMVQWR